MTEPTTAQMREWFDNASPKMQLKHQWVDVLLNRILAVETVVDKIRYASGRSVEIGYVLELLELFDVESGDLKDEVTRYREAGL